MKTDKNYDVNIFAQIFYIPNLYISITITQVINACLGLTRHFFLSQLYFGLIVFCFIGQKTDKYFFCSFCFKSISFTDQVQTEK